MNASHRERAGGRFIVERQLGTAQETEYARFEKLAHHTTLPVVASHTSALRLLGVELPERFLAPFDAKLLHISVGQKRQLRRLGGVAVHLNNPEMLDAHTVSYAEGFATVDAELALIQMSGVLDLFDLIVLGDCMMRRGVQRQLTICGLLMAVEQAGAFHGKRNLLRAIPLMRENTDSSYEVRTGLALACRGLGLPDVNAQITTGGETPWSVDMAYPELMTIVEYDGLFHMTDAVQGEHDRERRGHLRSRGWDVHEVTRTRIATPEACDALAVDVAKSFGKALDMPISPLPCIPIKRLADRRRIYRAPGLDLPQLERYFMH